MVLNRSGFWPSRDIWQCLLTFLVVTAGGWGRMLLAFYGQRTEMQVSIQQCTGHPKSSKHYSSSAGNPNQTQAPVKNKQREQALWVFLVVVAVQSLSHVQLFATPMDCSTPGFPVLHHLPELGQTQVHWVSDAIQPSYPLSSPSPPTPNPSQHRVFSSESTLRMRWPKDWSFSFSISPSKEHPGLISFNGLVGSPCSPRDSQESSPTPQFESINSSALSFLHSPTLTSIHDYWKNHSLD